MNIYIQCISVYVVLLIGAGLLLFPVGLDSAIVQNHCAGAQAYQAGACSLGWVYYLCIMGAALAVFCPFLACHSDVVLSQRDPDV